MLFDLVFFFFSRKWRINFIYLYFPLVATEVLHQAGSLGYLFFKLIFNWKFSTGLDKWPDGLDRWLGTLAVFIEAPGLVPSPPMETHDHLQLQFKKFDTLLWCPLTPGTELLASKIPIYIWKKNKIFVYIWKKNFYCCIHALPIWGIFFSCLCKISVFIFYTSFNYTKTKLHPQR